MNVEKKFRDYQFDNLKFILIVFVVVGHFIKPLIDEFPAILALYDIIFAFHMPFFIFVSGYFARTHLHSDKRINVVTKLLFTYMLFQIIYYFFYNYVMLEPRSWYAVWYPYWTLWYLSAMALWILMLPYILKLRYPVLITLTIGLLNGSIIWFTGSRVLGFLFFFVLGATFNKKKFEERVKHIHRAIPIIILGFIFTFIIKVSDTINFNWFYSKNSFEELGVNMVEGFIIQALLFSVAVAIMFCFYFIVPKRKLFISDFGARTLYVYLIHGFIVNLFVKYGVFDKIETTIGAAIIVAFAVLLTFILSTKVVEKYTSWLINPKTDRFVEKFKRSERSFVVKIKKYVFNVR